MPTADSNFGTAMMISGGISSLGSGAVLLTYFLFPELRKLRYVELVFYVALNDFIASVGVALGPSPNDSFECYYQGFTSNFNYICSVFWSTVIIYQVWLIVYKGSVIQDMKLIHLFCWGFALFLSLIPLSTNTYNNPDDESTWCFVAQRANSPSWGQAFWIVASFYVWIWTGMLVGIAIMISILWRLHQMQVVPGVVLSTLWRLAPYPFIILTCWSANSALNMYYSFEGIQFDTGSSTLINLYIFGMAIATCQDVDEDNSNNIEERGIGDVKNTTLNTTSERQSNLGRPSRIEDEIDYIPAVINDSLYLRPSALSFVGMVRPRQSLAGKLDRGTESDGRANEPTGSSDHEAGDTEAEARKGRIISTSTVDPEELRDHFSVSSPIGSRHQQQQQHFGMRSGATAAAPLPSPRGSTTTRTAASTAAATVCIDAGGDSDGYCGRDSSVSSSTSKNSLFRMRQSEWWNRSSAYSGEEGSSGSETQASRNSHYPISPGSSATGSNDIDSTRVSSHIDVDLCGGYVDCAASAVQLQTFGDRLRIASESAAKNCTITATDATIISASPTGVQSDDMGETFNPLA